MKRYVMLQARKLIIDRAIFNMLHKKVSISVLIRNTTVSFFKVFDYWKMIQVPYLSKELESFSNNQKL